MKRIVSLVMSIIICLSLVGCDGGSDVVEETMETTAKDDNTIELTMDNYKKYLDLSDITIQNQGDGLKIKLNSDTTIYGYRNILFTAEVEGVSQHHIYNDVIVTVQIVGHYLAFSSRIVDKSDYYDRTLQFEIPIETNVAGGGKGFYQLYTGWNDDKTELAYTLKDGFEVEAEVVSVSGSVTLITP